MEKSLTGLFGSGAEADAKAERARDFVKRYSEGAPDEGYSSDEAVGQLNDLLGHANSEQVERATRSALKNLPDNKRAEFGEFVNQLQARKSGGRAATSGTPSIDDISRMFGQAGGSANSVNDLFGSLFGGGSGTSGSATSSGGGIGAMLSKLLSSLFGGGRSRATQTAGASGMGDLGGLLGSNAGKMVMGGIAAYLTKELLDGKN
jgi:hypothetical protein